MHYSHSSGELNRNPARSLNSKIQRCRMISTTKARFKTHATRRPTYLPHSTSCPRNHALAHASKLAQLHAPQNTLRRRAVHQPESWDLAASWFCFVFCCRVVVNNLLRIFELVGAMLHRSIFGSCGVGVLLRAG